MVVRYRNEAVEELIETVKYYNNERSGLGFEFASEIRKGINRIKKYPESWPKISTNVRKCLINRFPFSILYYIDSEVLLIL